MSSPDYQKMVGFYVLGFFGVGITAVSLLGSIVAISLAGIVYICESLAHTSVMVSTVMAYVALGLVSGAILIGLPMLISGLCLANFYKKKATIQNNMSQYKFDGCLKNPEIALSIPL